MSNIDIKTGTRMSGTVDVTTTNEDYNRQTGRQTQENNKVTVQNLKDKVQELERQASEYQSQFIVLQHENRSMVKMSRRYEVAK